ncbi:MAG: hypothetical protein IJE05_05835 [Clostridia bacterium]|nr:hypothetical protein [Clostridia bacterium]
MKLQSLAVMFIILILPISLVLASYTQNRIETLSLQSTYDSKLDDATYDALKAYQLNSFNSETSDLTNSKMRDINASVNTFFNSMSTGFSSLGYTKETLQNYVPALVYTMYDGYYIYSPYINTWDSETIDKYKSEYQSFKNGETLYGLKPYVYYSCRYVKDKIDVVITYSLDNYIQIQGTINGDTVSRYGYLLNNLEMNEDGSITYNGVKIDAEKGEKLEEYIYFDGNYDKLPYIKKNGIKYYAKDGKVFYVLNGKSMDQAEVSESEISTNESAIKYYKEAYELKEFMKKYGLDKLTTNDIYDVDKTGNSEYYKINGTIFDFDNIESETSNFNTHRIDVIKHSIERNLSVAISNFNYYSGVSVDFQMPKLKDSDWDKIMDNISIISFLQGVKIGGKIYNGYSIITNTKNEDIVMEDSIYIKTKDNVLHRVKDKKLNIDDETIGVYNINVERRSYQDTDGNTKYYFPLSGTLSYDSIVTQNEVSDAKLTDYFKDKPVLAKLYYTALGRERYGLYRPKLEI